MKIFVIPSGYVSSKKPQHNIFVHEQCRALVNRGHEIIVLDANIRSPKNWNDDFCKRPVERFEDGVKIYSFWTRAFPVVKFPKLSLSLYEKRLRYLWDFVTKSEGMPDVIYSHFTFPSGYVATKISKDTGVPNVTMEHGGVFFKKNLHAYLKDAAAFTISNSSAFLCVSSSQTSAISKHLNKEVNIKIIPNMISNIFTYQPINSTEKFVFFSAGNLKQIKRFDLLIKSFAEAFKSIPSVVLRIAGEGEERNNLESLIASLGCNEQVVLLGRLSREEILEEFKNSNSFALASDHESFGIVYREATACGRPVVSTKNGGIEEGWNDALGLVVPCDNQEELSQALLYMYEHFDTFSPQTISELTLSYCSEKNVIDQIESVLLDAVGNKNAK